MKKNVSTHIKFLGPEPLAMVQDLVEQHNIMLGGLWQFISASCISGSYAYVHKSQCGGVTRTTKYTNYCPFITSFSYIVKKKSPSLCTWLCSIGDWHVRSLLHTGVDREKINYSTHWVWLTIHKHKTCFSFLNLPTSGPILTMQPNLSGTLHHSPPTPPFHCHTDLCPAFVFLINPIPFFSSHHWTLIS